MRNTLLGLALGLLLVSQVAPNEAVYGRFMSGVLGKAASINLNSVADTAISISATKYIPRKYTVTNCSATPVLAQLAFYTATAANPAGGVASITPAGTINTPTFTGTQFDNRSAFVKVIFCKKDLCS